MNGLLLEWVGWAWEIELGIARLLELFWYLVLLIVE